MVEKQAEAAQVDAVVHTAQMLSALIAFHEAKGRAQELVRQMFPLYSPVAVKYESGDVVHAIVNAYVADCPDRIAIMFENGNVWDKPVTKLTPLV